MRRSLAIIFFTATLFCFTAEAKNCGRFKAIDELPAEKINELTKLQTQYDRQRPPIYSGRKPAYSVNSKHVDGKNPNASRLPANAEELYRHAVPFEKNGRVNWYSIDRDGTIHRFQSEDAGHAHWNGSTNSTTFSNRHTDLQERDIPNSILTSLHTRLKMLKIVDAAR